MEKGRQFGLVSIITPTHDSEAFIGSTIESIQAQSYESWELLITDDASTDRTCEVVSAYAAKDPRIKLFRLDHNQGSGVARDNSIKQAKGRWIAFCDSDDRWYSDKLERQLAFMTEKDVALSYTSYDICNESDERVGYVECLPWIDKSRILRDNGIGCLTAMYDTQKVGKRLMPEIRRRQDWCLWIDIITHSGKALGIREPLSIYRSRQNSLSSGKIKMLKYNYAVYNEVLGFNKAKSAYMLFGRFMPYYLYKKFKQKRDFKKRRK